MRPLACKVCHGARLKPESLSYRIGDKNIADLVQMDLGSLQRFFDDVEFDGRQAVIATPIVKEIREQIGRASRRERAHTSARTAHPQQPPHTTTDTPAHPH